MVGRLVSELLFFVKCVFVIWVMVWCSVFCIRLMDVVVISVGKKGIR